MSLKKVLEELTGAFCEEAPEDAEYPYAVFSARRLSEDGGMQSHIPHENERPQPR